MRIRRGCDGIHLFDKNNGINVLFDEVEVPRDEWSRAPRFVSFALTNRCDLQCPFCYAPKDAANLDPKSVVAWSHELNENGGLGIGFGGGEPTLYPGFASLCRTLAQTTDLSISFTTHAHRLTPQMRDDLVGAVHFIRVSMDGVGKTYEKIRKRSFPKFLEQMQIVSETSAFGVNFVVNETTIGELSEASELAFDAGATELLLLPEHSSHGLNEQTQQALTDWVSANSGPIRVAISETGVTEGMPLADPFVNEKGTRAYIYVGANGKVSRTSYDRKNAVSIGENNSILAAIAELEGDCT